MDMQEIKQIIFQGEKVDIECKEAEDNMPKSVYESYSAFANTRGGYIILGVKEDKKKIRPQERFLIQGINNPKKQVEDFWNTINSSKVNVNILKDEDVFIVGDSEVSLVVIKVPRADYKMRPVYVGENPYKGTFKRNNEGDYHAADFEIDGMIRDKNPDGNDGMLMEHCGNTARFLRLGMMVMCGIPLMINRFLKNLVDTEKTGGKKKKD